MTDAPAPPDNPTDSGAAATRAPFCVLKKRRDFLAAARARKSVTPGLVLQARRRKPDEPADAPVRIGYTASKKVGDAVTRNRAKRRLRAVVAEIAPARARPGHDYVLIARADATVSRPFAALRQDLIQALERVHADAKSSGRKRAPGDNKRAPGDKVKNAGDKPRPPDDRKPRPRETPK